MSKAVLVIGDINTCLECPLHYKADELSLGDFKYQKLFRCLVQPEGVEDVYLKDIITKKPDWCPLKPMPEKKPEYLSINSEKGYCDGWNACIDAICGGEEVIGIEKATQRPQTAEE